MTKLVLFVEEGGEKLPLYSLLRKNLGLPLHEISRRIAKNEAILAWPLFQNDFDDLIVKLRCLAAQLPATGAPHRLFYFSDLDRFEALPHPEKYEVGWEFVRNLITEWETEREEDWNWFPPDNDN